MSETINKYPHISGLTEQEKAFICFIAYTGKNLDRDKFLYPDVEGLRHLSYSEINNLMNKLAEKGLLRRISFYSKWFYSSMTCFHEVDPMVFFEALLFLFRERKEWRKTFMRHRTYRAYNEIILKIASFICGEKKFTMEDISSDWDDMYEGREYVLEILGEAMMMDEWTTLADNLPDNLIFQIINSHIISSQTNGDFKKLKVAERLFSRRKITDPNYHYSRSLFRRNWLYFTGELLPVKMEEVGFHPTIYTEAAQLLFSGKVDEALKLYALGIKESNKHVKVKGFPYDALTLLLYVIALGIRRSADDIVKLNEIDGKIRKTGRSELYAVAAFVTYLKDGQQTVTQNFDFIQGHRNKLALAIVNLFKMYVGEKPFEPSPVELNCALIFNEICGINSYAVKENAPWEPLLGKIKRKEPWELKIEAIMTKAGGNSKGAIAERIERTIYYAPISMKPSDTVIVKLQKKTKKGDWSRGAVMSDNTWSLNGFEMDAMDVKIHGEWKKHRYEAGTGSFPKLSTVLRYCKGTDKLYTDYEDDGYGPVEIIEEKPYIYTERKDGRITFLSNVPEQATDHMYQWSKDRRSITFWEVEDNISDLFSMVVKLGSVPETSEPVLERMMVALKGKVEVQSDIQGAMKLDEKEGNSIVTARVTPERDVFVVRFMVRPLDGGFKYVEVGKGDEVIVDSDGKSRYRVSRNLKREKSNCKKVCDLLGFERVRNEVMLDVQGLLTLMDSAEEMSDVYCIEWPKGEGIKMVKPTSSAWNINAKGKGGWFEIEGDLRISEERVLTIAQLLDMLRESGGQYVRLSGGEYLKLSKKIRTQLSQLDAVSQNTRGKITIPELAMTFMKEAIDDIVDVQDYKMMDERKRLMREAASKDYPLPEGLNAVLRPYQEEGYRWLMSLSHWGAGACLADDMGLGKTVQSIAFMLAKAAEGPQMVVAPASVIGNWRKELARFSPRLRVVMLNEMSSDERDKALKNAVAGVVVVSTYGLLVTEKEAVTGVEWTTVVLDEAHTIKNKETKMSAVAMKLQATNKIMLTGTPVQNHLGELWNLFRFINPGLLGSYEHFQEKFVNGENNGSREALKRLVAPFLLRRTKNEVVRELPDKVELTIPVQMQDEEMAVYEIIRRQAKAELETGGPLSVNALAMMTKLRMAACSAMLAEKDWKGGCSKLDALMEKLLPIIESGNSVLVFSQFTSFLAMAKERLEREGVTSYLYLDGSTPVAKRQKMVEEFQRGEQQVFMISLKAGGLGLNLTGANYVIHLDPWWNPAVEQQATDRAYRIGQQQKVTVYHLIAEGTIEEKILRLHDTKREMADSILEGRSTAMRLTPEELLTLIDG